MEEQFEPLNTIPSRIHFSHNQIIFQKSQWMRGEQRQQIKKINFNAHYKGKQWLCQKISEQTYLLSQQLKQNKYSQQQSLLFYIKRILRHIVVDGDKLGMQTQHKILYLTFKYLKHLISKRSTSKSMASDNIVSIHEWLAEANALLFQTHSNNIQKVDDKLLQLLRRKDYEGMNLLLNFMASTEQDQCRSNQIQLISKIISIKIDNSDIQFDKGPIIEEVKISNQLALQGLKEQYYQLFQIKKQSKKANQKIESKDKLQIACEVLFTNYDYVKWLVKDSWPLYLSHIIESQQQPLDSRAIKQLVINFISPKNSNKYELSNRDAYFVDLISDRNLHVVYQSLLGLVSPYYAHIVAYYFYFFYEPSPLLTIMQSNYIPDLITSMLQHSSLVSYTCLFLTFSFLENNEFTHKNGQFIQPLLYYHLTVIDVDDQEEVSLFRKKINLLFTLYMQKFGFIHAKMFFDRIVGNKKLNQFVLMNLLFTASVYERYYGFEKEIKRFLDQYMQHYDLGYQDLIGIREIKSKLQGKKKHKKQLALLDRLFSNINKFQLLQLANTTTNYLDQRYYVLQLIKTVSQSRPLLSLILNVVRMQNLKRIESPKNKSQSQNRPQYDHFMQHLQVYIDHYPVVRSEEQSIVLKEIEESIKR